jgi:hypothetical protein
MGMGEKHRMNTKHLSQCQVSGSSTRINQDVVIQHQARRPQIRCNAATASKYGQANDVLPAVSRNLIRITARLGNEIKRNESSGLIQFAQGVLLTQSVP